jgi:TIR domain
VKTLVPTSSTPDFDFFVSYKWAQHAENARMVTEIAKKRGYTVWLDKEQIKDEELTDSELAERLRNALNACCFVIFFETYGQMAMQMGGPPVRVVSWQERELTMAEASRVITLYHSSKLLCFGLSRTTHEYQSFAQAMDFIEEALMDPTRSEFQKG